MQKFQDSVTDIYGNAIVGATVTVKIQSSGVDASLFSDSAGTVVLSNPITTDSNGRFGFFAADGTYQLVITSTSYTGYTVDYISLGAGGSMVYPSAGIPVSTGAAWGTPIANNSTNWNTAYSWGNHASAGYLTSGMVGVSVQGYDVDTAKLDVAQSWTAQQTFKELKDTVHTITDGAAFEIDPANGSIQVVTLGANRTPAATNFEAGQVVLLGIDDGTAFTITWTTVAVTWVKAGGTASAPTLATTGYTWIMLWKVGTTIYGCEVGKP